MAKTENTYEGWVEAIRTRREKPPIYFVNIRNPEGTSNPQESFWKSFGDLEKVEETIDSMIEQSPLLKDKRLAKFVVAFCTGAFVIYSWGYGSMPDFNLMKRGEWTLSKDYQKAEEGNNNPIFCPLENLIKAQETAIWCSPDIRTVSQYYQDFRRSLAISLINADKEFA